jgi:hypothetical protein
MRTVFIIPLLLTIIGLVSAAQDWMIINPVAETIWTAGKDQKIAWIILTAKDKDFKPNPDVTQINIDLMEGDFANANIVAHIATDVPVGAQTYTWAKVPDFAQGTDYFVRVGTDQWWRYTHAFTFNGKGTAKSLAQPAPQTPASAPSPDNTTGNSTTTTPGDNPPAGTGDATAGGSSTSTTTSSAGASATNKPSSNSNKASVAVTNGSATLLTAMLTVICVAFNHVRY